MKTYLLAGPALLAAISPIPAAAQVKDAPAAVIAVDTPSANLQRLFLQSDEENLKRNPLNALFRGDTRYADQFGDYISDAYLAAEKAAAEADLKALAAIDRSKLSADEQISYDVFKWQRDSQLKGYDPAILNVSKLLPIDHFNGIHQFVPDIFSGTSIAQFKTVKDYEDNLKRLDGFAVALDAVLGRMKQGVAAGVVQPKLVTERVLDQLNRHVDSGVDAMPLMMPVQKFPEGISAADQARLKEAYTVKVRDVILPRYKALRDYTRDVYLPASRGNDRPGLVSMPGGPDLYRYLVSTHTTTNMTPDEIHNLGLSEVKRIHGEMEKVMKEVGFKGTLAEFFVYIKEDPKFKPASREALTQGYYDIGKRVEVALPKLFRTVPKTPLEIRPYPPFLEKDSAGGSYMPGPPDGSRPGIFYFNAYDLPSRTTPGMETLYLHEGKPGHHFQIALALENDKLPSFQRFGGNTAFAEGWGLYAESLGKELGMFTDPYQYYGRLDDEMLRAMRLVVDTGLHDKGWSRQQAIDYMLANSSQGPTDVVNEVDRYVAMPGQALAYKVGDLRIQAARKRAEKALGKNFDIRAFHEQVLMTGALPLEVLDAKIDRWIASGGKS
ncbi:DUF885 domain-containing protein [Sandaracinobacter neustonicus]|uniref:DUF885 domain-containing protein n=1 Tax=Sandaracinobacter neustonicus TaxID=1715348 RepID=A0A501XWA0_9SPHN|nr:DUF885 domain-containing protein [Sandaracinobacter neustonicus]TPE64613.1 DUF885 domain-containing protein [Sandaracinobacter neustonicus]